MNYMDYINYISWTCLKFAVNCNTDSTIFQLTLGKICYIINFPSRKTPETNPGILSHPRWSTLQQYLTVGSRHLKTDPENLSHYLITIKTLKWSCNDKKIIWKGSWIYLRMTATSSTFVEGKYQRHI